MRQNNKNISLFKKLLVIAGLIFYMAPAAYAAEDPKQLLTCAEIGTEKEAGFIVSILEEEIGTSESTKDLGVFPCIRKTECPIPPEPKEGEEPKMPTCKDPVYIEPGEDCTPDNYTFCQRVQVLVAQSGVDLLMSYIGIIYRWAASVIGIISVIYLVWGGFIITTAQDNTGAIDKAKEKILQSIGGLVLLFLSAVILYTINPNFFII